MIATQPIRQAARADAANGSSSPSAVPADARAAAFARALRKSGFNPEDAEDLRENALSYAQRIVYDEKKRYPLGMMLKAFAEEDAEPLEDDDR